MFLNRIWGLYTQPKAQWQLVDRQQESMSYSLRHALVMALIPAICVYISLAYLGWDLSDNIGEPLLFSQGNALSLALILYLSLIAGVFALAYLVLWMARTFGASPNFSHALELAAYAATPLFMAGLAALAYSSYLLHTGIPIVMRIPAERSFIYAMSLLTGAWVLLLCAVVTAIMLWSWALMYLR